MHQHLVHLITATSTAIEKIFLLGSTAMQRRTHTIFHSNQPTCRYTSYYYVLVLVRNTEHHSLNNIRDTIETRSQQWIPVTAIVLAIETFTGWLNEGHLFARWVVQQATLLHDAGNHPLPHTTSTDEEKLEVEDKKLINDTKHTVASFLAGAALYCVRKEYKLAAFMLHQAAEQQLRTMLSSTPVCALIPTTSNASSAITVCGAINSPKYFQRTTNVRSVYSRCYRKPTSIQDTPAPIPSPSTNWRHWSKKQND